ncbi:hypothetical protein QN277_000220 [Acacia crassicarpa]|uniref:RNase H type-1 domain-containing protein n=1 Tax=Acacia crassicarpa TaxID=499986 RepID=A0AAE1N740_9FABA|nr:hypothetical protein QN277_000220 [Acacia crassicarpa]
MRDWMSSNLKNDFGDSKDDSWNLRWGVILWLLWSWRNSYVFTENFWKPPDPLATFLFCIFADFSDNNIPQRDVVLECWTPPSATWVKANVDGAVKGDSAMVCCSGVIRDASGKWLGGFSHSLGCCGVYEAEEWAVLMGLKCAWDEGFKKVILASDCKTLIDDLLQGSATSLGSTVHLQIRHLLDLDWIVQLQYTPRNQNVLADHLAKDVSCSSILRSCPDHLRTVLATNCMGLTPLL